MTFTIDLQPEIERGLLVNRWCGHRCAPFGGWRFPPSPLAQHWASGLPPMNLRFRMAPKSDLGGQGTPSGRQSDSPSPEFWNT